MAVGDLEGKIGELNGQLKMLTPIMEELGRKVGELAERGAANKENVRQIWQEIHDIKRRLDGGGKKWWQILLAVISPVIAAIVTIVVMKLMK